jgi:hypothetical protein
VRVVTVGASLIAMVLMTAVLSKADESGSVRVINRTASIVDVLVRDSDIVGIQSWRVIATVQPRSWIELPQVPSGATLGARSRTGQEWPPRRVEYGAGRTIFEYVLAP